MKPILSRMLFTLAVLWLALASGSAQVLSPVYSFASSNTLNLKAGGLLASSNTLFGTVYGSTITGGSQMLGNSKKLSNYLSLHDKFFTNLV